MSEENIKKLYDKAQKYLKTENLLIEHEDFDSVISRTYYAMYYMVKSILLTKDIDTKTHRWLISAFGEHFVKTNIFSKEMSKHLRNAFDKRLIGDYDFTESINKIEAEKFYNTGKKFINDIKEYLVKNNYL